MFKLPFGRKRAQSFGLDIGSSSVKVVQLRQAGDGYALGAMAVVPLPPDSIADGTIKDPPTVIAAIKEAVQKAGISSRDAVIGICGRELIIKKIQIPEVPAKELAGAVQLEAEHHIPFAADEVFLDHHVVGSREGQMELILVAVKKAKVVEYTGVVEEAGLIPTIVDVDGFAIENQYEINTVEPSEEAVALIDIGAAVMKTNVTRGGASIFARDIPFGGNRYTEAIASALSVSFEEAEAAKVGGTADPATIAPAIESVSRELALEVQRTFDYFASTAESERIGKIVLSGGCAQLPGLTEYLTSTWGIPVETAQPFGRIDAGDFAGDVAGAGTSLAVAVGLALRTPGDKAQ
ncbi:MAG: type IV pilus assembly protein PilM [Candidatus Rokubacteria bacterium]|nr:type IV pilus assembly protein PilM [Candidatus Rokubacteria bacterium]